MRSEWDCVVDAGNSRIKIGWFKGQQLHETESIVHEAWATYAPKYPAQRALLASVSVPETVLQSRLLALGIPEVRVWHANDPLPFGSDYLTAQTMGSDRKMLVMGANRLYPGIHRLVVGLGTCITYDLIDAAGHHRGGDISPGMHMRWQAMHQFTARLPLASLPDHWPLLGNDTLSALQSGVLQGIVAEIEGRKRQLELILSDLTIILSGGDAQFFEKRFDSRIFAEPNLALYGLHALL
ncbi:MAG: pantothenate kinase [Sphingobacteriaceae bacterium]|nr:pantothenate kinase [Sphingobacteriaceae bacterium]